MACSDESYDKINNIELTPIMDSVPRSDDPVLQEAISQENTRAMEILDKMFVKMYPGKVFDGKTLSTFGNTVRYHDRDGSGTFTRGETVYESADAVVDVGEKRLANAGRAGSFDGSTVAGGNPDVGFALSSFANQVFYSELYTVVLFS